MRLDVVERGARVALRLGDGERAANLYRRLADERRAGDDFGVVRELKGLAHSLVELGCFGEARAAWEECRALLDAKGEDRGLVIMDGNLAELDSWEGQTDAAARRLQSGLAASRASGDVLLAGETLHSLGNVELDRGDWSAARRYYGEALQLVRSLRTGRETVARSLAGIAAVEAFAGRGEQASLLWGASEAVAAEPGVRLRRIE